MKLLAFLMLAFALAAPAHAERVAVYESEENAREYHGVYQEPLRAWLAHRGQGFTVIGDAVAADPAKLAAYPAVLASSTYLVPEAARQGLARYVAAGGQLLWIDSPARVDDPAFRALLGVAPGSTYAPLTQGILEPVGIHPASPTAARIRASALVGNWALKAAANGRVLCEASGTAKEGAKASFPALLLAATGKGRCLLYNWIPWLSREPEVRALLDPGLDYLLARKATETVSVLAGVSATLSAVQQPESVVITARVFSRAGAAGAAARCEATLFSPAGKPVAHRSAPVAPTAADDALAVASARLSLSTGKLPDGDYLFRWRVLAGTAPVASGEGRVTLEGQRWARLRAQEKGRRKLLWPGLGATLADYDAEPRTPEGRVDIPRLLQQITTAHIGTYDWLIWHAPTDWEDLQRFLPLARERRIRVWVTLCPPSEQGGKSSWSEPYRLDFVRWADEIGKLSLRHDNLAALVIDDFMSGGNVNLFTPSYIAKLAATLRARNPRVALLPTLYWNSVGDAQWMRDYGPALDGIIFPYAELETGDALAEQLRACRKWIGPDKFLIANVYTSGSSGAGEKGPRSAAYLRRTITLSHDLCDGVRLYCLPKEKLLDDYRYAVAAELFGGWYSAGP